MDMRIVTREDVEALACRLTGNYAECNYAAAWGKLMQCLENNGVGDCGAGAEYISLYCDNPQKTPPEACRLDVCIAAEAGHETVRSLVRNMKLGDGVRRTVIPGGRYAVFVHRGPYERLCETYAYIYGEYLPKGEVTDDSEARGGMFEKYLCPPGTPPEQLVTEIYIPIK